MANQQEDVSFPLGKQPVTPGTPFIAATNLLTSQFVACPNPTGRTRRLSVDGYQ
jgi:hypothetical protein